MRAYCESGLSQQCCVTDTFLFQIETNLAFIASEPFHFSSPWQVISTINTAVVLGFTLRPVFFGSPMKKHAVIIVQCVHYPFLFDQKAINDDRQPLQILIRTNNTIINTIFYTLNQRCNRNCGYYIFAPNRFQLPFYCFLVSQE